jgi:hypothetical protein
MIYIGRFKEAAMILSKRDLVSKTMAIIAFTCIIISLVIILITPPASRYEISIYNAYPWYFWFFMLTAIFIGQLIVLKDVFYRLSEKNYYWLLGVIAFLIPVIIFLFLPTIRGYPTYGLADHLYHIGEVKDIVQFGSIGQDNFYPNLHILIASSILVTGGGVISIINFLPIFFFLLTPIFIYLFYKIIFNKKNEMKFALILASAFLFFGSYCVYVAPYNLSFLLVPIILYLYFKRGTSQNKINFSLLFIILVVGYTFYHPLNLLLLILVFLFLAFSFYLFPKINNVNIIEASEKNLKEKSMNIVLFSTLLFFSWYFSFSFIVGSFRKVFLSIFYSTGESFFQSQVTALSSYSPKLFDTLRVIVYTYGLSLIVGILSIFSLIYTFIKWQRNKKSFKLRFCFVFSGIVFLVFSVLLAGAFFTDFIVGWGRFICWTTIFSIILIALAFYNLLSDSKNRNIVTKPFKKLVITVAICLFLISLTFLSTFTFYSSPITGEANSQVTNTDWEGIEWIMDYRNITITIDELGISQWRFSIAIYGLKEYHLIEPTGYSFKPPPDHFSYHNKTSLGKYYNQSRYMILTLLAKILYPESYPSYKEQWRFTPEDFDQLQADDTVCRIFNNGGFDAYFIRPNTI